MAGESKFEIKVSEKVDLDPIVDVVLPGLGFTILVLLAWQLFEVLRALGLIPHPYWLVLISAVAVMIGLVDRKMRRGQHNLPKMIRIIEVGVLLICTYLACLFYPRIALILSTVVVMWIYHLGYRVAKWTEELLFDFVEIENRGNWKSRWGNEGLRLYNRHIVGFNGLLYLVVEINLLLALAWIIRQRMSLLVIVGGGLIFFLQFLFIGVGFYQKKRVVWAIQGFRVQDGMLRRLVSLLLIVALGVSGVAMILPVKYDPVPWETISDLLTRLFSRKDQVQVMEFGQIQQEFQDNKQIPGEILESLGPGASWHMTLFLIFIWLLIIFFVIVLLGFILSLVNEERFRLQGFRSILIRIYQFFRGLVTAWFNGLTGGVKNIRLGFEEKRRKQRLEKLRRLLEDKVGEGDILWDAQNPREEIILIFIKMMNSFSQRGVTKGLEETLTEYLEKIIIFFPTLTDEVRGGSKILSEALYSHHEMSNEQVEEMKRYWRGMETGLEVCKAKLLR